LGHSVVEFAKASFGKNPEHPLPPSPLSLIEVPSGADLTRDTGLPSTITETASAIDKTVMGLASFVTSPQGAEQMATYGVPVLKLPMAAKWISDMVKGGYLNVKDAVDAFKKGDTQRLRDDIIGATANFLGAIGVAGGEHARIKDYFNKLDKPEAVAPPASREAPAPMNERDAVSNIPAAAPVLTGASLYPLPKGAQPPKETPPAKPQEAQHPKSTEDAYRIGLAIKTPEELANLKAQQESFGAAGRKAMAEKRINDASGLITTAGFYREAYEAATGTGSAAYHFRDDPNYKPPFPQPEVESKNASVVAPQEASGVAPAAATPPEQSFKRPSPPQVAQPLALGGSSKLPNGKMAKNYAIPGFEEYRTALLPPEGNKAKGTKAGWRVVEATTGLEISHPYLNRLEDTPQSALEQARKKMQQAGKEKLDAAIQKSLNPPEPNAAGWDKPVQDMTTEEFKQHQADWKEARIRNPMASQEQLAKYVAEKRAKQPPTPSAKPPAPEQSLAAAPAQEGVKEPWEYTKSEWSKLIKSEYGMQGFPDLAAKQATDATHAKEVADAVKAGKPVPVHVLLDYPNLIPKPKLKSSAESLRSASSPSPSVVKPELPKLSWGTTIPHDGTGRYSDLRGKVSVGDYVVGMRYVPEGQYNQQEFGRVVKVLKGALEIERPDGTKTRISSQLSRYERPQELSDAKQVFEANKESPPTPKSETPAIEPVAAKPADLSGPGSPSVRQGPDTGGGWAEGDGGDVYGIAQRVREARAKAGQVAPVASGQGVSAEAAVDWGREILKNGGDAEKALRQFESDKKTSFDLIAVARAKGEELAKAARNIEEKFGTDSKEFRMAQKALSDWDTRTKSIQTEWHKQGMAQQGETDIDTGSFTGIARAVREVTGEDLNSAQAKTAKQIAKGVADADKAVEPAKVNLQTAIDNLTETGAPRYSDTIIKIAEKIVSSLDKRADAARARIRARAFTFSANIDPTVLRDVAEIGASHIAHWGLDFAKWSKVMVDEFGDKINPHLKTIFDASQKLVDAEGDKHGPNAETVKKAVKKTGGTKAPTDLAEQQKVFQDYQSGKPMTPIQVKTLWQRAKDEYINGGDTNMGDTVHKLADDLGIPAKDVLSGLSQTKQVKRIADDVWQKQRQARLLKQSAKRWVEHSQETWLQKVLPATAKTLFTLKVNMHGTVAMGTHAPLVVATHPIVFANNFGKMYKLVASPEYFEMQKSALARRPNYNIAQRNGLVNDMNKMEDFNDPQLAQGFPKMAAWFKAQLDRVHLGRFQGMGTRGYSVLKILRQDLFDHEWDKLSESQKSDSMAKAISDSVNHITGVTKAGAGQLGKAASYALFAPKLEASRVAVMVADPLKAANSLIKMGNMTEAEKWFVKNQFKEKAKVAAVGFGLLLANQQLNNLFGDKKKLNGVPASLGGGGWNPMASDFMKFRVAGMNFAWGSPFLTMARLPLRLYQIGAGSGGKTKYLIYPDESMYKTAGSYLRTQASPFLSPIISVITKGDYADRPLPQIPGYGEPPPVPKRLAAQGVKPYTWPEFLSDIVLPIPVEQAMNDIWHSHELSNTEQQDHALTKAFVTGIIMAGTGGRVSDDWNKGETAAPTTRPAANPFKIQKPRL
jgi:hypothetical protein